MDVDLAVVCLLIYETCGDTVAQKSPDWDSDGESWSESEGLSSSDFREHNVERFALHVIGLNWSGEQVPFCWKTGLRCRKAFFEGIQES